MLCWFWKELWKLRCRMVTFFYLSSTFFFEHFLQGTMDLMYRMVFFKSDSYLLSKHFLKGIIGLRCSRVTCVNLIFTFFFEHFLQGTMDLMYRMVFFKSDSYLLSKHFLKGIIGLRCSRVTFVNLIFTFFLSNFCKELWTWSVGIFYLISTFFFKHFLPGIMGLRCRMVTFFYLSFTFFFEHFLQGTMDLKHRLITSPQRHLTNSLQTACGHLTIFTFPPLLSVEYGGVRRGVRGDVSLSDFQPPLNINLPGHGFWRRRGLTYI